MRFWKQREDWPGANLSIGEEFGNINGYTCWEIVGPASEQWTCLQKEIRRLFNGCESLTTPVLWPCYTMGRHQSLARPTVVFCCPEKKSRQQARAIVKDSGVLDRFPWFKTAVCSHDPGAKSLISFAAQELSHISSESFWIEQDETSRCQSAFTNQEKVRQATIGGCILHEDQLYLMTAAHAFSERPLFDQWRDENDSIEFDIDESDDEHHFNVDDETEAQNVAATSAASVSTQSSCSDQSWFIENNEQPSSDSSTQKTNPTTLCIAEGEPVKLDNLGPAGAAVGQCVTHIQWVEEAPPIIVSNTLDCAFISITTTLASLLDRLHCMMVFSDWKLSFAQQPEECPDSDIVMKSFGSTLGKARLSANTVYLTTAAPARSIPLWTARSTSIGLPMAGICGAWAQTQNGRQLGHVVAGDANNGVCYLVPARLVFNEMAVTLGEFSQRLRAERRTSDGPARTPIYRVQQIGPQLRPAKLGLDELSTQGHNDDDVVFESRATQMRPEGLQELQNMQQHIPQQNQTSTGVKSDPSLSPPRTPKERGATWSHEAAAQSAASKQLPKTLPRAGPSRTADAPVTASEANEVNSVVLNKDLPTLDAVRENMDEITADPGSTKELRVSTGSASSPSLDPYVSSTEPGLIGARGGDGMLNATWDPSNDSHLLQIVENAIQRLINPELIKLLIEQALQRDLNLDDRSTGRPDRSKAQVSATANETSHKVEQKLSTVPHMSKGVVELDPMPWGWDTARQQRFPYLDVLLAPQVRGSSTMPRPLPMAETTSCRRRSSIRRYSSPKARQGSATGQPKASSRMARLSSSQANLSHDSRTPTAMRTPRAIVAERLVREEGQKQNVDESGLTSQIKHEPRAHETQAWGEVHSTDDDFDESGYQSEVDSHGNIRWDAQGQPIALNRGVTRRVDDDTEIREDT